MKKIKFFETSCIDIDTGINLGITKNTRQEAEKEAELYISYLLENGRKLKSAIARASSSYRWASVCVWLEEYESEFGDDELDENGEYIGDDDFDDLLYRRKNILSTDTWVMSIEDANEKNASFSVIHHTEGGTEHFSARAASDNFECSQLISHIPEDIVCHYLEYTDLEDDDIITVDDDNINIESISDEIYAAHKCRDWALARQISDKLYQSVVDGGVKLSPLALAEILEETDGIEI